MADITKKVDRIIPPNQRTQNFELSSDYASGDVLMIEDSLGHPADQVTIETGSTGSAIYVRFNVYQTVFPRRPDVGFGISGTGHLPLLTSGVRIMSNSPGIIEIESSSTYSLDKEFPVKDIHIYAVSGITDADIWVS